MEGTYWFNRFRKECKIISPYIRFLRIKYGFYRLYWVGGGESFYLYEVYKDMPYKGYDIEELDPHLQDRNYYEEYEDHVKTVRTIKNFVEGYWDSIRTIKKRVYMLKNNKEFRKTASRAYRQFKVK
ncbi:MAG: hypothetical protein GWP19_01480 [Planctomycetia bacterium]|nr:hypothetical protein [Planctomycetia bacterium]